MQSDIPIEEARRLRDRLDRCEREMQRFLEVLVHDVRATQRGINTSAELLRAELESKLGEETRQTLDMLQGGVAKMNALLAGVGNYSMSLPAAHHSFGLVPMEIPLRVALSSLAGHIHECGATVTHGTLPQVRGDIERLTWLFQHLIGNALKYRSSADPRVDIQAHAGSDHWTFSVQDNGIGIAHEYWDGLFVPFHRLHGPEIPGVGLGLAISKKILETHGGRIWIESKLGEGSTFFFTLPEGDGI